MDCQQIIMNFSAPPSLEDIEALTGVVVDMLPDELARECEDLSIIVEDIADDTTLNDLDLDDAYDLPALYKSAKEIAPGIERKVANDDDVLVIYRRAVLDVWVETGDDLQAVIRQTVIDELGRYFEFSDDDIEEMSARHYQGML